MSIKQPIAHFIIQNILADLRCSAVPYVMLNSQPKWLAILVKGAKLYGVYCKAWKQLFRCLYDNGSWSAKAEMGDIPFEGGGGAQKADIRYVLPCKTQKGVLSN